MNDTTFPTYKTIKLEKMKLAFSQAISPELLIDANVNIEEHYDWILDTMLVTIKGYLWSEPMGKEQRFEYPADWWQAFKIRWFPKRLLDRYPPKMGKVIFTAQAVYPDFRVSLPDQKYLIMTRMDHIPFDAR